MPKTEQAISKIEYNNITWLDIKNPNEQDIDDLKKELSLSPSVVKELPISIKRPKIEEHQNYLWLVLHFPVFDKKKKYTCPTELDFIVTRDKIITLCQEVIPALKILFDDCQIQDYLKKEYFKNTGYLLFCILDNLIDSCLPMLDHVYEHTEEIENQVFQGKEKEMLAEIAIVKRDLINFRRTIKPQRSVLEILAKKADRFFGHDLRSITQEVVGSNIRVWNTLENHKELIDAIDATNNSLLSYKISDIVKILTIVSFITFPLAVVTGFFGMNLFDNVPFTKDPLSFIIVLVAMIIVGLLMILYFIQKKWL